MNYYQMDNQKRIIYPAILLDRYISYKTRKIIRIIAFWIVALILIGFIFSPISLQSYIYLFRAIFFFFLSIYIGLILIETMYRSYYFTKTKVDIRVLGILERVNEYQDITLAFIKDPLGEYVLYRLGFFRDEIEIFIKEKNDVVTKKEFEIIENDDDTVSFAEFGFSLLHFDSDLSKLLKKKGILAQDFKQTLDWIAHLDKKIRERERWWSRSSLLRFPSIGKNLAFGEVYYLERLGHNIVEDTAYIQLGEKYRIYQDTILKMEAILSKQNGGNLILTAKESYITKDVLASFAKQIRFGKVLPEFENKRIYILDISTLLANYDQPIQFENVFQNILKQSAEAGNVVLVLPDFAEFIEQAYQLSVDIRPVFKEALSATGIHVIITSNEKLFHEVLETDLDLMTYFEKIHLNEFDEKQAMMVLEQEVIYLENKHDVFFTFPAIKRIVQSADRYFSQMSLLDKSIDILDEAVFFAKQTKEKIITPEIIDMFISSKTGVMIGAVSLAEAQKLSTVQEQMKSRVIGQNEAVSAVCNAMMRARADLADPKRPFASFLFVGPTGVGKTETAKVLAELFFGDKEQMLRSDMSEYSDVNALERMIGTPESVGIFASKVREKASGVLLLDEFEKASSNVQDLFLQIIDEGFFTDGRGERVMMRNFIIVATSNAGSELWAIESQINKQFLIQHIASKNIFKLELLNRFDEVVLFNFLTSENVKQITHFAFEELVKRLDSKGIQVKETPEIIEYLAQIGTNPQFGAREIHRVIKKEIESKVAQALVLGDLFEGDIISFTLVENQVQIQKYS